MMHQQQLNHLTLMRLQHKVLHEIKLTDLINKFGKVKMHDENDRAYACMMATVFMSNFAV